MKTDMIYEFSLVNRNSETPGKEQVLINVILMKNLMASRSFWHLKIISTFCATYCYLDSLVYEYEI